jgi:Lon protease-like protein
MQAGLLPLFPLPIVLLPGMPLPLHIFEPRYREMIADVLREDSEFGVVLVRGKGILNTGCTAAVAKVLKRHSDGRMDILTTGRRRFEVISLDDEKSYLRAAVNFFDDDEPGEPVESKLEGRALDAWRALSEVGERETAGEPEPDAPALSFRVAQLIDDLNFRQRLLQLRSEAARLRELVTFCEEYIPRQRMIANLKRVQPLNGHGRLPVPPDRM